jgi:succinate dehydrogenase hydrophobic anchor subunit
MGKKKKKREKLFEMPGEIKQIIWGIIMIVFALLVVLSFFGKAGSGGRYFMKFSGFLIGNTVFLLPLVLIIAGVILLISRNEEENFFHRAAKSFWPVIIAVFLLLLGVGGILGSYNVEAKNGGMIGFLLSWPFL